jgi:hypothetical protein
LSLAPELEPREHGATKDLDWFGWVEGSRPGWGLLVLRDFPVLESSVEFEIAFSLAQPFTAGLAAARAGPAKACQPKPP